MHISFYVGICLMLLVFLALGFMRITAKADSSYNDDLVDLIKAQEGFRSHVYRDIFGTLTVGYGTNLEGGLTPAEGEALLRMRLSSSREALAERWPHYTEMPPEVRAALDDMAYQLGVEGVLGFHDMLAFLTGSEWEQAARAAEDSVWYQETPHRVERITKVFRGYDGR